MSPNLLLQETATKLVARYWRLHGASDVRLVGGEATGEAGDLVYELEGVRRNARVKADPYFGLDEAKVGDRSLIFYRADAGCFALEMVSDAATRSPGWVLTSTADEILYAFLAIDQTAEEVDEILSRPGDLVANGLRVERSELHALPLEPLRVWFEQVQERYPARPVTGGATASWVRLVPRDDVFDAVGGARILGPIVDAMGAL